MCPTARGDDFGGRKPPRLTLCQRPTWHTVHSESSADRSPSQVLFYIVFVASRPARILLSKFPGTVTVCQRAGRRAGSDRLGKVRDDPAPRRILNDGNIAVPCLPRRTWQSGKVAILSVVTFGASVSYDNRVTLPAWQTDLAIWQTERSNADRRETKTTGKREVTMCCYDSVTPVSAATGAVPSWQSVNPGMV
jgi:hypothetical protein